MIVKGKLLIGLFLLIIGFVLLGSSTLPYSKNKSLKEWSEWIEAPCFKGIDYRYIQLSPSGDADYWKYELRSRYSDPLHLSLVVKNPRFPNFMNGGRVWLNSTKTSKLEIAVLKGVLPSIGLKDLSFGSEYNDKRIYQNCDK